MTNGKKHSDLMVPTVHLNGTSRDELSRQVCQAYAAVVEAGRALAASAPNGRDYYPQGQDAIIRAMTQHELRMRKLREVADELQHIAEQIA